MVFKENIKTARARLKAATESLMRCEVRAAGGQSLWETSWAGQYPSIRFSSRVVHAWSQTGLKCGLLCLNACQHSRSFFIWPFSVAPEPVNPSVLNHAAISPGICPAISRFRISARCASHRSSFFICQTSRVSRFFLILGGWVTLNEGAVTGNSPVPARNATIAACCAGSTQIAICFFPDWRIFALKTACRSAFVAIDQPSLLVMDRVPLLLVTVYGHY